MRVEYALYVAFGRQIVVVLDEIPGNLTLSCGSYPPEFVFVLNNWVILILMPKMSF